MKIVFFGTPEFAVESLDKIINDGHEVCAVVTMPDKIAGRGHKVIQSDVKKYAVEKGLDVLQPTNLKDPAFIEQLRNLNADIFVVIAFRMLPEAVWAMPANGTFNLHASLLPKYRGAAPINRAIMNGEKKTGVTTFFLQHEIDTGDIIESREIAISEEDNAGTIHDALMHLGAEMVGETLKKIESGDVKTIPQPDGEFTPAPKIFSADCELDFNNDAATVHNHIRGLSPYPCAKMKFRLDNGKEMECKILRSEVVNNDEKNTDRKITINKGELTINCGVGKISILTLKPAGKKEMQIDEFLRGYHPTEVI